MKIRELISINIRGLVSRNNGEDGSKKDVNTTTERTHREDGTGTDNMIINNGGVSYTNRFNGVVLLIIVFFIGGLLTFHTGLIGGSIIALFFIFVGSIQSPPDPVKAIDGEYSLSPKTPRPGEPVTVTLALHNTSKTTFTDMRVIDDVPPELEVTSTNARRITTIRPDETKKVTYTVTAKRGEFDFNECFIRTRSALGTVMRDTKFEVSGSQTLTCSINIEDTPLEDEATEFIGQLLGISSGEGLEFDKTREYHRGDSPRRINWRALAKRGELSTIMFREQQAATVTIVLDARTRSFVSQRPGAQSAPVVGAYAAYQLTSALGVSNHSVNMVAPGLDADTPTRNKYGYYEFEDQTHRENTYKAFELIESVENKESVVDNESVLHNLQHSISTQNLRDGGERDDVFDAYKGENISVKEFTTDLKRWGDKAAQYVFITPLLDGAMQTVCQEMASIENAIVIIPNPTVNGEEVITTSKSIGDELSERILATQQAIRVESLRNTGVTVIDWNPKQSLETACERQTLMSRKK